MFGINMEDGKRDFKTRSLGILRVLPEFIGAIVLGGAAVFFSASAEETGDHKGVEKQAEMPPFRNLYASEEQYQKVKKEVDDRKMLYSVFIKDENGEEKEEVFLFTDEDLSYMDEKDFNLYFLDRALNDTKETYPAPLNLLERKEIKDGGYVPFECSMVEALKEKPTSKLIQDKLLKKINNLELILDFGLNDDGTPYLLVHTLPSVPSLTSLKNKHHEKIKKINFDFQEKISIIADLPAVKIDKKISLYKNEFTHAIVLKKDVHDVYDLYFFFGCSDGVLAVHPETYDFFFVFDKEDVLKQFFIDNLKDVPKRTQINKELLK